MLRIGLTGGIAAGKSTAAERFAELGARVVDHDVLARRAVEPGSAALVDIVKEFGDRLVVDGRLDRQALAEIVFSDPAALERLNGIVHPTVFAMGQAEDRIARRAGEKVVVHDIPLLFETGYGGGFDLVITVQADRAVRIKRLMDGRGMSHEEAAARMSSQASDEQRASISDVVLDGSGSPEHLQAQIDALWEEIVPSRR